MIRSVKTPTALAVLLSLTVVAIVAPSAAPAAEAPAAAAAPADWPQFLGPQRNGTSPTSLAWPQGGPNVRWSYNVGSGWSGPVVVGDRVYIHHRKDARAVLDCLDLATGKPVWTSGHDTDYSDAFDFDDGPRATPTVAGDRIFTYGAEGIAAAFDLKTGKQLWAVDTVETFRGGKGFFGFACSPLVEGNVVILNVGGKGAGVVGLDVATGKTVWSVTDDEAGYSSPTAATIGGVRYAFVLTRSSLVCLTPTDGKVLWQHPFRSRMQASVNAATPIVVGDEIFITAAYNVGAQLLKFGIDKPTIVWGNDDTLSSHYATPVVRDGHLFGLHGRQEQAVDLRCIEWKTGKVVWTQENVGAGSLSIAGDKLLFMSERGELIMSPASPAGFKELGRRQLTGFETRSYPAIAGKVFVVRGKQKLVCAELAEEKK